MLNEWKQTAIFSFFLLNSRRLNVFNWLSKQAGSRASKQWTSYRHKYILYADLRIHRKTDEQTAREKPLCDLKSVNSKTCVCRVNGISHFWGEPQTDNKRQPTRIISSEIECVDSGNHTYRHRHTTNTNTSKENRSLNAAISVNVKTFKFTLTKNSS